MRKIKVKKVQNGELSVKLLPNDKNDDRLYDQESTLDLSLCVQYTFCTFPWYMTLLTDVAL